MFGLVGASVSLDVGTLFVIAICVTSLLGLFLLFAWMQERIQALAWWGLAYLIGSADFPALSREDQWSQPRGDGG